MRIIRALLSKSYCTFHGAANHPAQIHLSRYDGNNMHCGINGCNEKPFSYTPQNKNESIYFCRSTR